MKKNYHVIRREDGNWAVVKESAQRAASIHPTQAEAVESARQLLAKQSGAELMIHKKDGTLKSGAAVVAKEKVSGIPSKQTLAQRVGERLKRARLMRGHSLRSLADELDGEISHSTIQQYETGIKIPDTKSLGLFARALGVRPDYFLKKSGLQLQTVEYRKQAKLGKKTQVQLEEQAFEFFERYLEIENLMHVEMDQLPRYDFSTETEKTIPARIEKAVCDLRKEWGLGMNPIANVHLTLEQNGVKVRILPAQKGFDGFSAFATTGENEVPTIALSNEWLQDLPRFRFTALHELGHLVLKLPEHLEPRVKEGFCHRFAGAFLVPKTSFIEAFGTAREKVTVGELAAIKAEWGISCAATMRRAADLGSITQGRYKGFCIWSNKYGFRKNEPQTWSGSEDSARFEQLVFHALAEDFITSSKACGLLGISQSELAQKFDLLG
ncbi:DUF2188 domain-containing protein [Verrucomicrobiaceae bacterium R5-34]|nr:DUF2188 domain-containing protein [Verrucomicrobiaceae bacterium R5-34]